ncbi:MAG: hypothetical protein ACU85E_10790 [Gammaproteobacteria bacterium]
MYRLAALKLNRGKLIRGLVTIFAMFVISLTIQAQPLVVDASEIQNCRYLDSVQGSSGYGKKFNWQRAAKHSALSQADRLGASHLVWEGLSHVGVFNGVAVGKAYNCNF